jgi:hypothetical protein
VRSDVGRVLYLLFGLFVLGAAGFADYRGWSIVCPTELHNLPRSIRDNPGSYRALYRGSPHYFGGK